MKYYIIIFDPKQQDWDEFRQNGKIVYFKSEKEAQKFGDAQRKGDFGRIFRQGDWQVIGEAKQTMKITKSRLKDIIREELAEATESHQHFKFSDNRSAEDFAQEIANSALATGKVKGDTVEVNISKIRKARTHKAIAKIMTKFGGRLDFKITLRSQKMKSYSMIYS